MAEIPVPNIRNKSPKPKPEILTFQVGEKLYRLPKDKIKPGTLLYTMLNTEVRTDIKFIDATLELSTDEISQDIVVGIYKLSTDEISQDMFDIVYDNLMYDKYPQNEDDFDVLDYFLIEYKSKYEYIMYRENHIRASIYNPEFKDHQMNTDLYYDLIKLDEASWNKLRDNMMSHHNTDNNLLFKSDKLKICPSTWDELQFGIMQLRSKGLLSSWGVYGAFKGKYTSVKRHQKNKWINHPLDKTYLELLKGLRDIPNSGIFIAGGSIYNALLDRNTTINDIDVFLYGYTEKQAELLIRCLAYSGVHDGDSCKIDRSTGAITLSYGPGIQIILRLYRSPSEILHGFDVDSCCMGYDGKDVYMTHRCYYALMNMCNTVDFDRMSPTYELRLCKYALRGIPVRIIGFDRTKINYVNLDNLIYGNIKRRIVKYEQVYKDLKKVDKLDPISFKEYWDLLCDFDLRSKALYKVARGLNGLNKLIYMEYLLILREYKPSAIQRIKTLCNWSSDYGSPKVSTFAQLTDCISYIEVNDQEKHDALVKYQKTVSPTLNIYRLPQLYHFNDISEIGISIGGKDRYSWEVFDSKMSLLFNVDPEFYEFISKYKTWKLDEKMSFKVINPGEQATGTFHKLIYEDRAIWYGSFYNI